MPALHDEPNQVKVVHQFGIGIHDELYPAYLDPAWQRKQLMDYVDFAVEAEELGYDGLTLTEHHLPQISNPAPHLMLAHVAAKTSRIRLGTAITVLPFYDPIRVVEEAAMLDLLSGGRFELGLGRGNPHEYAQISGNPAEQGAPRFAEGCDLIELALSAEEVIFDGQFSRITEPRIVTPKPLQQKLPVWIAAQSLSSISAAAERGWNVMRNFGSNDEHRAALEHYIETGRQHGHQLTGANFMISRFVCIGETEAEAEASENRLLEIFSTGFPKRRDTPPGDRRPPRPETVRGTPDQVLAELQKTVQETGSRRMMLEAVSIEETRLFGREVLPALHEATL